MSKKTDQAQKPFDRCGEFMLLTTTKPGASPFWVRMSSIERVYPMNTNRTKLGLASREEVVIYELADDILTALNGQRGNEHVV